MTVSKERLEALKQIIKAFETVPAPNKITEHDCDECRSVDKTFTGKNFETIEPEIIDGNYDIIPLFSPEAFRYFLPAYLFYSLDNFSADDRTTTEFTIYALSPTKQDLRESLEYWQARFEDFTFEQLDCIYDFLDLIADDETHEDFAGDANGGRKRLKTYIEPIIRK